MRDQLIAGAFALVAVITGGIISGGSFRARLNRSITRDLELLERLGEGYPHAAAIRRRADAQLNRYVQPWSRFDGALAWTLEVVLICGSIAGISAISDTQGHGPTHAVRNIAWVAAIAVLLVIFTAAYIALFVTMGRYLAREAVAAWRRIRRAIASRWPA